MWNYQSDLSFLEKNINFIENSFIFKYEIYFLVADCWFGIKKGANTGTNIKVSFSDF